MHVGWKMVGTCVYRLCQSVRTYLYHSRYSRRLDQKDVKPMYFSGAHVPPFAWGRRLKGRARDSARARACMCAGETEEPPSSVPLPLFLPLHPLLSLLHPCSLNRYGTCCDYVCRYIHRRVGGPGQVLIVHLGSPSMARIGLRAADT